jgi:hypothetical protein
MVPPLLSSAEGPLLTLNFATAIGEVWANMLHNVLAELVHDYGFDAGAKTNPNIGSGNAIWLQLFMKQLMLQPCNPTRELVVLSHFLPTLRIDPYLSFSQFPKHAMHGYRRMILCTMVLTRFVGFGSSTGIVFTV